MDLVPSGVGKRMRYEQPRPIGLPEAEVCMASGDPALIADAILRASLSEIDAEWVEGACLRSLERPDLAVRWAALTALGHLVRRHGRLDINAVLRAIEPLRLAPGLSGRVDDLLDDIKMFAR